jgi:hypothetical protein
MSRPQRSARIMAFYTIGRPSVMRDRGEQAFKTIVAVNVISDFSVACAHVPHPLLLGTTIRPLVLKVSLFNGKEIFVPS